MQMRACMGGYRYKGTWEYAYLWEHGNIIICWNIIGYICRCKGGCKWGHGAASGIYGRRHGRTQI